MNKIIKNTIVALALSLAVSACQPTKPETGNSNQKPDLTAAVTPTAANSEKSKIRLFDGSGKITKINLELGSVELDHKEIKGLMPAMTMEFYVSDKKMLDDLKVGDQADFVLEDNAGAERIVSIRKK